MLSIIMHQNQVKQDVESYLKVTGSKSSGELSDGLATVPHSEMQHIPVPG